jgi:hypothetical protein
MFDDAMALGRVMLENATIIKRCPLSYATSTRFSRAERVRERIGYESTATAFTILFGTPNVATTMSAWLPALPMSA